MWRTPLQSPHCQRGVSPRALRFTDSALWFRRPSVCGWRPPNREHRPLLCGRRPLIRRQRPPQRSQAPPEGAVSKSEGTVSKPGGTVSKPGGTVRERMGKVREPEGKPRESEGNTEKLEGNLHESEGNAEEPEGNRSELKRQARPPSPDDTSPGDEQRPVKGLEAGSSGAVLTAAPSAAGTPASPWCRSPGGSPP